MNVFYKQAFYITKDYFVTAILVFESFCISIEINQHIYQSYRTV